MTSSIKTVAVCGAGGTMGAGIAIVAARAGFSTICYDTAAASLVRAAKQTDGFFGKSVERGKMSAVDKDAVMTRLSRTTKLEDLASADLVIEAVFEDLSVKKNLLGKLGKVCSETTIFATNTSTIPIRQIATHAKRPERVLGMHFFSPVEKMPLLEVIPTLATSPDTIVTAVRFGRRMGKTVIVVSDRPGFWVNRILSPYLNEAGHLLQEGAPIGLIDRVMTDFGFPVGPVALLDEVGLDVAEKAGAVMHEAFGERMKPAGALGRMLGATRLGRKNGQGFYKYTKGHKAGVDNSVYPLLGVRPADAEPELVERRLVYSMLNEAAMACAEDVVRSPRDGDVGAIFGIGFPAFRGGPLRMIDDLGPGRVVETLYQLQEQFGERFRPAGSLLEMARGSRRYYPA